MFPARPYTSPSPRFPQRRSHAPRVFPSVSPMFPACPPYATNSTGRCLTERCSVFLRDLAEKGTCGCLQPQVKLSLKDLKPTSASRLSFRRPTDVQMHSVQLQEELSLSEVNMAPTTGPRIATENSSVVTMLYYNLFLKRWFRGFLGYFNVW